MTVAVHHPGEILAQRLEAVGVSPTELARQLDVPANRITQIINGLGVATRPLVRRYPTVLDELAGAVRPGDCGS